MKTLLKIFIVFILLCFMEVSSYAVGIDMNISNNVNNSTVITDAQDNTVNDLSSSSSSTAKVSTTQTSEDFTLSVSDIINIILIAVGIVLIFLAIAILLKIK